MSPVNRYRFGVNLSLLSLVCLGASIFSFGCGSEKAPARSYGGGDGGGYYDVDYSQIQFVDDAQSNTDLDHPVLSLSLKQGDGSETAINELAKGKTTVLVITRGYFGDICPYCSTQVSRLATRVKEFEERDAQVIVVYPVEDDGDNQRTAFINKVDEQTDDADFPTAEKLPFPILLDVELQAVDKLGIRDQLSKPATYILDADGRLRYAYVGAGMVDRPSIDALLKQLDALKAGP